MPTSEVHGTLSTGASQAIGATEDGRLEVDADFSDTSVDAFGRLRTSSPFTLFDSSYRFADNGLWNTSTATGGTAVFNANEGCVYLSVTTSSGSRVYRETTKVFSYQPGKSLFVINTFAFNAAKTGLKQRCGYFGASNGMYAELDGATLYFCKRSSVGGSVVNTRVAQSDWNVDRLDGAGPSGVILDISKSQLMWMDIEWTGTGNVRIGFVIDNVFIHCHSFKHANIILSTYITTASLPLRYEIENTSATSSASTLKQICSTVISEGGYQLSGLQQPVWIPIESPRTLGTAGVFYPVISVRLKTSPDRLDAIAILTNLSAMAISAGNYNWQIRSAGTTSGGTWVSAGTNSCIEYNITGTSHVNGRVVANGYFNASNQSTSTIDIPKEALFKFQLERNTFTSTPFEISFVIASDSANDTIVAGMDWEEISR
jgi:hypothetical protein